MHVYMSHRVVEIETDLGMYATSSWFSGGFVKV